MANSTKTSKPIGLFIEVIPGINHQKHIKMVQKTFRHFLQGFSILLFTLVAFAANAQEKISVDTEKVESWFEKNWIWVAAAVVLLIIIALFSSKGNRTNRKINQRKTTTVIKDPDGNVKSITTTEDTV